MKKKLVMSILFSAFLALIAGPSFADEKASPPQPAKPTEGWTLHIDAKRHFPNLPEMVAHHYCKAVSGGLTECQIYDSDKPDARLVAVEVIVDKETWKKFPEKEKALWHYHKFEIPRVDATLHDVSFEEAAKIVKSLEETYGKVYILWDPAKSEPMGKPRVSILH
ncbi:MAG TPA: DUF1264 domain-containing protein [Geobacteraceae bacterium]